MQQLFLVGLGGAIGAMVRFEIGRLIGERAWPVATLLVNISGGLLMGLLAGLMAARGEHQTWRLLLGVGMLGGYTTFSAFSLEVARLIEQQQWLIAIGYVCSSVLGAIMALFLGLWIARSFS